LFIRAALAVPTFPGLPGSAQDSQGVPKTLWHRGCWRQ